MTAIAAALPATLRRPRRSWQLKIMRGFCRAVAGAGALIAHASSAAADCPVQLDGDPAVTAPIRSEVLGYGDASAPCVAVRVECRGDGTEVEIELRDELGRTSQRWFASPGGAAAFIVSWSRRPISGMAPGAAPAAGRGVTTSVAPGASRPTAPAVDRPWHPEIDMTYMNSAERAAGWAVPSIALIRQTGLWRYGGGARALVEVRDPEYVVFEGFAALGLTGELEPRSTLNLDVLTGGSFGRIGARGTSDSGDALGSPRASVRASYGWRALPALELQLAFALDVMVRANPISKPAAFSHIDVTMRWLP